MVDIEESATVLKCWVKRHMKDDWTEAWTICFKSSFEKHYNGLECKHSAQPTVFAVVQSVGRWKYGTLDNPNKQ